VEAISGLFNCYICITGAYGKVILKNICRFFCKIHFSISPFQSYLVLPRSHLVQCCKSKSLPLLMFYLSWICYVHWLIQLRYIHFSGYYVTVLEIALFLFSIAGNITVIAVSCAHSLQCRAFVFSSGQNTLENLFVKFQLVLYTIGVRTSHITRIEKWLPAPTPRARGP